MYYFLALGETGVLELLPGRDEYVRTTYKGESRWIHSVPRRSGVRAWEAHGTL